MPYLSELAHFLIGLVDLFDRLFGALDVLFDKRAERSGVGIAENADQIGNISQSCTNWYLLLVYIDGFSEVFAYLGICRWLPSFIMVIDTTAADLRNVLTDYPGKQTISRY
jgi:hypothetical protein